MTTPYIQILGQCTPGDALTTLYTVSTVPPETQTVVKSLVVCNNCELFSTFREVITTSDGDRFIEYDQIGRAHV